MCKNQNNKLKLLVWNIEGLVDKVQSVDFINYVKQYDIACLVETWCENLPLINEYVSYGKIKNKVGSRGRMGGGICIYYKEILKSYITTFVNKLDDCIWLKFENCETLMMICAVYLPPDKSVYNTNNNFYEDLEIEINCYKESYPNAEFVILGDFNSRIGNEVEFNIEHKSSHDCPLDLLAFNNYNYIYDLPRNSKDMIVNRRGRQLLKLCREHDLVIANGRAEDDKSGEFTFISHLGQSCVDYILLSPFLFFKAKFTVGARSESSHMPLICDLNIGYAEPSRQICIPNPYITKFIWQDQFKDIFLCNIDDESSSWILIGSQLAMKENLIDRAVSNLNFFFYHCGSIMKKTDYAHTSLDKFNKNKWFDTQCSLKKTEVKSKLRQFRFSNSETDLQQYLDCKKQFKQLCKHKKGILKNNLVSCIEAALEEKNEKSFWNIISKNYKSNYFQVNKISERNWIEHFSNLYAASEKVEVSKPTYKYHMCDADLDKDISIKEIEKALNTLKAGKAGGYDGLPPEFLKNCKNNQLFASVILNLFNLIFEKSVFPSQWSVGVVQTLYKGKGDPADVSSYRGITLLPVISKLFTKILSERLSIWAEANNVISPFQAGFRKGYGCMDNIFVLDTLIKKYLTKKRRKLFVCFVDFRTAFDSVSWEILWEKLKFKKISSKMLNLLKSIYSKVYLCMNRSDVMFQAYKGVRQGCHLSSFLFSVFIDDIIVMLNSIETHAPCLSNIEIKALLYADDLVLLSESVIGMQRSLNILNEFCIKNQMQINIDKTKMMIFSKGSKIKKVEKWTFDSLPIEIVNQFKYLGVTFSSNGQYMAHVNSLITQSKRATFAVRKGLYDEDIKVNIKSKIFLTAIQPILTYGSELWGAYDIHTNIDKQCFKYGKEILQASRSCSNYGVLYELGWKPSSCLILKKCLKYYFKISNEHNKIIQKKCFEFQCANNNDEFWVKKVKNIIDRFKIISLVDTPYNKGKFNKYINQAADQFYNNLIVEQMNLKSSLSLLLRLTPGYSTYLSEISNHWKKWLVKFRLGNYLWDSKKNVQGERICSLCNKYESPFHIIILCEGMSENRKKLIPDISDENWIVFLNSTNKNQLIRLAKYLKQFFDTRDSYNK